MGVAILKLFYVYYRTEQMSKCNDILGRQDSYWRRAILKKWNEGRQRKTNGVDLEVEVFPQYIYIFSSSAEKV